MPEYIFNTTVLSNFSAVKCLDMLKKRYEGTIFTTVEVYDELRRGKKSGYDHLAYALEHIEAVGNEGWIRILVPESRTEHLLRSEFDEMLDPGEASCLALAISRSLTFATDDLAARKLAAARNVRLTGTLGILIVLIRSGQLPLREANMMLADMLGRGYRSPVERLDNLI